MALWHLMVGSVLFGITIEVLFTSIGDFIKKENLKLQGNSYLWMFLVYALVPFIFMFILSFDISSIFVRAIFYMMGFYLLELISGEIIKKLTGKCPWNYRSKPIIIFGKKFKTNFKGLINFDFIPFWYIYGLVGEFIYLFLEAL